MNIKLFFLLISCVFAVDMRKKEIIKITHCSTQLCNFSIHDSLVEVQSRYLRFNKKISIPNTKWNETEIRDVKGGVLLIIPLIA